MMKKLKINFIAYIILFFLATVTWPYPAHAESTVAQLALHAHGNAPVESSGDVGHAFLSIKNTTNTTLNFLDYPIPAKEMITVSIWPDTMSPIGSGGVFINREMVVSQNINMSSISINITQKQLDTIASKTPQESYYHDGQNDTFTNIKDNFWHNCTTYSTKMWNLVAPKQYKITDGILGVDAPMWVVEKINKMSGHQEGPFVVTRNVDSSDIFYVTKNKEIVPAGFKVPDLYTPKVSKNSVSLSWSSCRKWLLNGQTNITGYEVKYSLSDGSQSKTQTFSSENGTITGLAYGKTYNYQVRAIYEKAGYHIAGQYSSISSFTTSKAPKASIKLNKSKLTIYKGKKATLKATVTGASTKVKWKSSNSSLTVYSSNSSIAAVNSKGKITAKKAGTCKITATANGKKATCIVTVKSPASANNAYKKIIQKYESKYGKAKLYTSGYMHYWKGLCFAKLLDFNGDGTKELVLAYQNGVGKTGNIKYHVELWTYNGKKAKRICSSVSWSGNNCEYFGGFSIAKTAGNYLLYLSDGANGNDVYYGKKADGTLGAVHSFHWKGDIVDGQWYYNGKAITVNEYSYYYQKFHQSCTIYSFSSDRSDKTIRSELDKTKKALKM